MQQAARVEQPAQRPVNINHEIAIIICQLLDQRKRTQTDLAEFLGVSQSTVSKRLRGQYAWPLTELIAIGRWLRAKRHIVDSINNLAASA